MLLAHGPTAESGLGDRRHPIQKVCKARDELKAAIKNCKKTAGPHDAEHLNASTLLSLSNVKKGLRIIDGAIDGVLNAGNALPAKRPPDKLFNHFLYELEIICRSVDLPVNDDDFIDFVCRCQRVLPPAMRKTKPRVKNRVLDYRKCPARK